MVIQLLRVYPIMQYKLQKNSCLKLMVKLASRIPGYTPTYKSFHFIMFAETHRQLKLPAWWQSNYLSEPGLAGKEKIRVLAASLRSKLDLHPSVSKKEESVPYHKQKRNQVPALL